ncbi:MAG: hypothetical protein FJ009_20300 [Chloroflexi bacterium]|nr:hypothetical protein [Chloroflexota bacterium]
MAALQKRIESLEDRALKFETKDWRNEIRQGKCARYVLAWTPGWRRGLSPQKIAEVEALAAGKIFGMELAGATVDEIIAEIEQACSGD